MNNEQITDIFIQLLEPFFKELGIKMPDSMADTFSKFSYKNTSLNKILKNNVSSCELFDDLSLVANQFKVILLSIPELSDISISKFNGASELLTKAFAGLSNKCTKKHYEFFIDIDGNNEEYLIISDRDKPSGNVEYKLVGMTLRKLMSDIMLTLNDDAFLHPTRLVEFKICNQCVLETDAKLKPKTYILKLDLDDMMTILNYITIAIDDKFAKVIGKEFKVVLPDEGDDKSTAIASGNVVSFSPCYSDGDTTLASTSNLFINDNFKNGQDFDGGFTLI